MGATSCGGGMRGCWKESAVMEHLPNMPQQTFPLTGRKFLIINEFSDTLNFASAGESGEKRENWENFSWGIFSENCICNNHVRVKVDGHV